MKYQPQSYSIDDVLRECASNIPPSLERQARDLVTHLNLGVPYTTLGGVRLRRLPSMFRFKLGRGFRLICVSKAGQLLPALLMTRQDFENFVRRRR